MFGSSGWVRVRVRVGFDLLICGFFGFSLFRVRVEKIVFKIQNFRAGSGQVFGSGQFLTGLATYVLLFLKIGDGPLFNCVGLVQQLAS